MDFRDNLFVPTKYHYARGTDRPDVDCILCAVVEGNKQVVNLKVHDGEHHLVSLNLFPYNPGHLMIFPKRHVLDLRDLTPEEDHEMTELMRLCIDVLEDLYSPSGFNVGLNQGQFSGASIDHLHMHVVPRYKSEVGFLDVVVGARVIVEDPIETRDRLRSAFARRTKGVTA